MKKIFIVLSVLLAVAFGASQAIGGAVGTMDDVLAPDVFAPFFLVDRDLTALQENTLIAYQEMRGVATTTWHGFVYTRDSVMVFDWYPPTITPWDVDQWYVSDILSMMPAITRATLEVTVDGKAYYAGYIVLENLLRPNINHVGGWVYQVSLANGKASCSKLPSREWALGAVVTDQGTPGSGTVPGTAYGQRQTLDFTAATTAAISAAGAAVDSGVFTAAQAAANFSDKEGFSANAFTIATERTFGRVLSGPSAVVATWNLFPRYYLYDSTGATYFFIWTNVVTAGLTNHVDVYDEDETALSIRVSLPNELNIINARDYIPPGFITAAGNDFGFFNFNWGTVLNPINNTIRCQDWIVYSYQSATGPAAQSWNVLERGFAHVGT